LRATRRGSPRPPQLEHLKTAAEGRRRCLQIGDVPVVFSVATAPEFPGTNATCFGVRLPTGVVLVTAAHVVRDVEQTKVEVPIAFGEGHREALRIAHIHYLTPSTPEYDDVCDVAVMVPTTKPPTGGKYFRPVGIETIANVETMKSPQLYAVAGYPRHHRDGNPVDYERRTISFRLFHAIGTYQSKAAGLPGCHTLKLSTEPVGGAQGLSGSPVFRVLIARTGAVSCARERVVPARWSDVGTFHETTATSSSKRSRTTEPDGVPYWPSAPRITPAPPPRWKSTAVEFRWSNVA
jgi:hypothetical protein